MKEYEIQLAGGRVVTMSGRDPEHACLRAADLYDVAVVAWREPRFVFVAGVDPRSIKG